MQQMYLFASKWALGVQLHDIGLLFTNGNDELKTGDFLQN